MGKHVTCDSAYFFGGGAGHHGPGGYILENQGPRRHLGPLAYGDATQDGGVGPNQHIVIHLGVPVAHLLARPCRRRRALQGEEEELYTLSQLA